MTTDRPTFAPGARTLAWQGVTFQHRSPLLARDAAAAAHLYDLLLREAAVLASLSTNIAAVGASPSKFNDVGNDPWQFARVDQSVTYDDGYFGELDAQRNNPALDPNLAAAIATLDRLERSGWRQWWIRAFGEWFYDNFLVLMVQDGAPWLLYATSNAGDHSSAYSLWQENALVYFGETRERMDESLIDDPEPLQFILTEETQWQDDE